MTEIAAEYEHRFEERKGLFKQYGYDIDGERDFIIKSALPLDGSILEVGTGKGHFTITLAQQGYHLTSVDVSEAEQQYAVSNARRLGLDKSIDFQVQDAEQLNFIDKTFETILSVNALHHFSQPLKVMAELRRVLSSGGKIVLSDFSEEGFNVVKDIHRSEGREHPRGRTNLIDIQEYFSQQGFKTEKLNSKFQDLLIATAG